MFLLVGGVLDFNIFDIIFFFVLLMNICGLYFFFFGWYIKLFFIDFFFEVNFVCMKYFCNELYGYVIIIGFNIVIFIVFWNEISVVFVVFGYD